METLTRDSIEAKLGQFAREIFIDSVKADRSSVSYIVNVSNSEWLMNDHFPGTSIIQCFYQGAMLLFYENDESFDPQESLFFAGGIKVKFLQPIFKGDLVKFSVNCERFVQNVLLFEATCVDACGKAYAKASGSLSSKKRAEVAMQKSRASDS